ncbi:MAG: hypothetical protein JO367_13370 [Actinobacteria bacterium]|nr:hypothetical protein [Actinomycetota bacterium]MBV9935288.1 hypothetical protein [Actinomycetota bacterium]
MRDRDWDRFGALVGVMAVAVLVVAVFLSGSPPKPTSTNDEIRLFIVDKRWAILTQAWLFCLASGLFVWFAGAVRSVFRRAEGDTGHLANVFFGVSVLAQAVVMMAFVVYGAYAYKAGATASADLARFVFDVGALGPAFAGFPLAVAAFIYAALAFGTEALPRWTGWLALLTAAAQIVGTFGIFAKTGAMSVEGVFGFVPFVVAMVWVLGVSAAMFRALTPSGSRASG